MEIFDIHCHHVIKYDEKIINGLKRARKYKGLFHIYVEFNCVLEVNISSIKYDDDDVMEKVYSFIYEQILLKILLFLVLLLMMMIYDSGKKIIHR